MAFFNTSLAKLVGSYGMEHPPIGTLDGIIDCRGHARSGYVINIATTGHVEYPVNDQRLPLQDVSGVVSIDGPMLGLDLKGEARAGLSYSGATISQNAQAIIRGKFDLVSDDADGNRSAWSLGVAAPGRTLYKIAGKNMPLDGLSARFDFGRDRLDIPTVTASLFGGEVVGTGFVDWHRGRDTLTVAVQAKDLSFGQLAALYAPDYETGGRLTGGLRFTTTTDGKTPLRGGGTLNIRDGNIFAIPMLGPLSPLLSAVLPGKKTAYGVAKEAKCGFTLGESTFTTQDFEATTNVFIIKAAGNVNYETQNINLEARINTRGPTALLFYLPGQLLSYEAHGTLDDPQWNSRLLSLPFKLLPGSR
jgi:hypothetical protein